MAAATPAPNLQIILGDSRTDPPHPAQTPTPPPDRAGLNHIGPVNGQAKALACRAGSVVEDGNEDVLGLMSVLSPLYQTQGQIEEEGGWEPDREGGSKKKRSPPSLPTPELWILWMPLPTRAKRQSQNRLVCSLALGGIYSRPTLMTYSTAVPLLEQHTIQKQYSRSTMINTLKFMLHGRRG